MTDPPAAWPAYWKAQEQPWRTEPEIDDKRQEYLKECFTLAGQQGNHPFKDMALSRADVEWLIVPHRDEAGSVVQSDRQRGRHAGLDLQGANLQEIVLQGLPLEGAYPCGRPGGGGHAATCLTLVRMGSHP